jgi:ribonuclease HI
MPCRVHIVSDSTYVCDCVNTWLSRWVKNKWVGANGNRVQNVDLLWKLANLMKIHRVTAHWTKSHTGKRSVDALGNACVDCFAQWGSDGRYMPVPDYETSVKL